MRHTAAPHERVRGGTHDATALYNRILGTCVPGISRAPSLHARRNPGDVQPHLSSEPTQPEQVVALVERSGYRYLPLPYRLREHVHTASPR